MQAVPITASRKGIASAARVATQARSSHHSQETSAGKHMAYVRSGLYNDTNHAVGDAQPLCCTNICLQKRRWMR